MNNQEKVKMLLKYTGMDIWTLSDKSGIKRIYLTDLMTSGESTPQLTKHINNFALSLNLCPECLSSVMHQGGCKVCFCGWSAC